MLAARDEKMAKILANMDDEEDIIQLPDSQNSEPSTIGEKLEVEKLKQQEIRTAQEIVKLEKAKSLAKSDQVKEKIAEEIRQANIRKEELRLQKEQQTATFKTVKDVHGTAQTIYNDAKTNVDGTVNKIQQTGHDISQNLESISTPGSIWLPVSTLLIFFFLLLPVNGMTRAQWLYQTLIGNARIGGAGTNAQPPDTSSTGGGSSGGFGGSENGALQIRTFTR